MEKEGRKKYLFDIIGQLFTSKFQTIDSGGIHTGKDCHQGIKIIQFSQMLEGRG